MNFYSRNPINYDADCKTAQREATAKQDYASLHAHGEFEGAVPRQTKVACNEGCRSFRPEAEEVAS